MYGDQLYIHDSKGPSARWLVAIKVRARSTGVTYSGVLLLSVNYGALNQIYLHCIVRPPIAGMKIDANTSQ